MTDAISAKIDANKNVWLEAQPSGSTQRLPMMTSTEAEQRRLEKLWMKTFETTGELERRLGIEVPWKEGDEQWCQTADMVNKRRYHRCLDKLEQLVVSRMFELSRMNRSGTGESPLVIQKWIIVNVLYRI